MGEDTVDAHFKNHGLQKLASSSAEKHLHGYSEEEIEGHLQLYGADAALVLDLQKQRPELKERLHEAYPYTAAEVVWAVREEMALKIEDFLSRRCRILLLDAKASMQMAPKVAEIMAKELKKDGAWITEELEEFNKLAKKYLIK